MAAVLHQLLHLYTRCVTRGDVSAAQRQLKLHLREHIAWERDTVWRQMIGRGRRAEVGGNPETVKGTLAVQQEAKTVHTPTSSSLLKPRRRHIWKGIGVAVFLTMLRVQNLDVKEASVSFSILVFSSILWASEVK